MLTSPRFFSLPLYLLDDFLTMDRPYSSSNRTMAIIYMLFNKLNILLAKKPPNKRNKKQQSIRTLSWNTYNII